MKRAGLAVLALLCCMQMAAQEDPATAVPEGSTEAQRIEAARAREEADFTARQAACHQRFAVNDCLKKLQAPHLAVLADLKRQETRLHDRERAQRGAEQLQRSEQKVQERNQAAAQAEESAARAQEKLQAQQEKQAAHAAKLGASAAAAASPSEPSGPSSSEQASFRESYAAKQKAAEKKRQEIAKRLKDKQGGKPVPPLPVPP
jgi:hypothetical protein